MLRLCALLLLITGTVSAPVDAEPAPDIIASNAFYYYDNLDAAWQFYRDTLGFETVADYGFAKILRLADTSYITLVRASEGMHSADEPKTVLLTLRSNDQARWQDLLERAGVPVMDDVDGRSLLFEDTEGYLLRIEERATFGDVDVVTLRPPAALAGDAPDVHSTVYTVYVESLDEVDEFYNGLFATRPVLERANEIMYSASESGLFAIREGSDGRLRPTDKNGVTLSFLTTDVDGWYARAADWPGFELRTPDVLDEGGLVRVFVGYDPAGTFLEWDTFLPVPENSRLLDFLPR